VEALAEQRRSQSVDHDGPEVEDHCAGQVLAARGLVIKNVDALELSVAPAAVFDLF
jgi:hypothetical protein